MSGNHIRDRPIPPDIEQQEDRSHIARSDSPVNRPDNLEYDEDDDSSNSNNHPDDPNIPTPRFMQDEGSWKRWKWVPYSVRRRVRSFVNWSRGPQPPRIWTIDPVLPAVQHAPLWLMDRFLPRKKQRVAVYMGYVSLWVVIFAIVMWRGQTASDLDVWGTPAPITCNTVYWQRSNECGIDGINCRPFNGTGFAFRCPANCAKNQVLNPRAVGAQEIVYRPLVIGGPPEPANGLGAVYRADSFLCGSAIHAGIISNDNGGCGVVELVGTQQEFISSSNNGIDSIGFDSYFPKSFAFQEGLQCSSRDVRWSLVALTVTFTAVLSLFTASSSVFFFSTFIALFWEVGLASDPPGFSNTTAGFSDILGKFLPAMFCAWVFYDKMGVKRTLGGLTAQVEKTVLWLGGCWVGALSNYTFDFIPIQRLTGHDLEQQPGAKAALAIIVIVLFAILVVQVWFFQQEGRLNRYFRFYLLVGASLGIAAALPNLNLRIHHYVLAILLLPATSIQTRPSLLYQGILIGLFINGIARWGFDPVLQTELALRGDGQIGSPLPILRPPEINTSVVADGGAPTITFRWEPPPSEQYDAISVLVNDVERFRGFFGDEGFNNSFVWTRGGESQRSGHNDNNNGNATDTIHAEYFRFAFMDGTVANDYTKAGIWNADLTWVDPKPGPSKIKRRGALADEVGVSQSLHRRVS